MTSLVPYYAKVITAQWTQIAYSEMSLALLLAAAKKQSLKAEIVYYEEVVA